MPNRERPVLTVEHHLAGREMLTELDSGVLVCPPPGRARRKGVDFGHVRNFRSGSGGVLWGVYADLERASALGQQLGELEGFVGQPLLVR